MPPGPAPQHSRQGLPVLFTPVPHSLCQGLTFQTVNFTGRACCRGSLMKDHNLLCNVGQYLTPHTRYPTIFTPLCRSLIRNPHLKVPHAGVERSVWTLPSALPMHFPFPWRLQKSRETRGPPNGIWKCFEFSVLGSLLYVRHTKLHHRDFLYCIVHDRSLLATLIDRTLDSLRKNEDFAYFAQFLAQEGQGLHITTAITQNHHCVHFHSLLL